MFDFNTAELRALVKLINKEEKLRANNISLLNIYEIQRKLKFMQYKNKANKQEL